MKKRTGCLSGIITAVSAFILACSVSITALADGEFAGDITITEAVEGYEYKVYEVLECIAAGGEDSIYMAAESWKEFLRTNENAVAMLIPTENDGHYPMAEEDSELYTVNPESDKELRQAFAEDALEYAKENVIDAYESITAESGESRVTFEYVPLGIYVIDTAGRVRITIMWDMDWQSTIKESYKPEAETGDTGTAAEEKKEIQQDAASSIEASGADEEMAADAPDAGAESGEKAVEGAAKADSKAPVMIVTAAAVLAAAAVLFFVKKKK